MAKKNSESKSYSTEEVSLYFEEVLADGGEIKLLTTLIEGAENLIQKDMNLEIQMIEMSDRFLELYRRSQKEIHFVIAKVLRRAAHKIYRKTLSFHTNKKISNRFLNIIK